MINERTEGWGVARFSYSTSYGPGGTFTL